MLTIFYLQDNTGNTSAPSNPNIRRVSTEEKWAGLCSDWTNWTVSSAKTWQYPYRCRFYRTEMCLLLSVNSPSVRSWNLERALCIDRGRWGRPCIWWGASWSPLSGSTEAKARRTSEGLNLLPESRIQEGLEDVGYPAQPDTDNLTEGRNIWRSHTFSGSCVRATPVHVAPWQVKKWRVTGMFGS